MKYYIELDGIKREVEVSEAENLTKFTIDDEVVELDFPAQIDRNGLSFMLDHRMYRADITSDDINLSLQINNSEFQAIVKDERRKLMDKLMRQNKRQSNTVGEIKASMPGLIIKLNVTVGETVDKGSSLIVMEAMKMENEINSPINGIVDQCHVGAGQAVSKGQLLMSLKNT